MSKYTEKIARKKFSMLLPPDHLSGSAFRKKDTIGADGKTVYSSELKALAGDREKLRNGTITREQWVARWPNEKASVGTSLLGGITNVVKDAAKLAVAPVTLATGGNVTLSTGVGKVVGDASKIAVSPISSAVSSIKGADVDLKLQTKAGKAVNAVVETGSKSLHGMLKGFADTVTAGYATKAANLIRSDENKEKAFNYTEMTPTKDKTGIKLIDKATQVLPAASTALGSVVAGVVGGTKLADMLGTKKEEGNMKPDTTMVGENVLQYQLPLPESQQPLQASYKFEPWHILAVIIAIGLLYVVSKYAKK